jgi:tetratricopeptide (TPR) repeat protein
MSGLEVATTKIENYTQSTLGLPSSVHQEVYALGQYDPKIGTETNYNAAVKLSKEGKEARTTGHYSEAIEKQSQAIRMYPSASHYYGRSLAYFAQGLQAETDRNQQLQVSSLKYALQDLGVARSMHRDWRIPAAVMKVYDHLTDVPEFPNAKRSALKAAQDALYASDPFPPPPAEKEKLKTIEHALDAGLKNL